MIQLHEDFHSDPKCTACVKSTPNCPGDRYRRRIRAALQKWNDYRTLYRSVVHITNTMTDGSNRRKFHSFHVINFSAVINHTSRHRLTLARAKICGIRSMLFETIGANEKFCWALLWSLNSALLWR